jgi:hypothetical protein
MRLSNREAAALVGFMVLYMCIPLIAIAIAVVVT